MLPSEDARVVVAALGIQRRRCRFQRIRGVVRARVHRARALAPRAGARMLELVRCARLVLAGWPSACVAEMRGPGKPWCFTAPLPSEAVRHTIPALRIVKTKVCGQELRLVLLCPSHETSGPKLLAVQLPHERLRFCMAVPNRIPVPAERRIWGRMVLWARLSGASGGPGPGWPREEDESSPSCAATDAHRRPPHVFHTRPRRCEPRIAIFELCACGHRVAENATFHEARNGPL